MYHDAKGGAALERDIWKACALKSTPGRRAVLEVLEESRGPVTAEEVYRRILARGGEAGSRTCLSTVYRTLSTLAEKGLLLRSAAVQTAVETLVNRLLGAPSWAGVRDQSEFFIQS